jgi:GntR family transcriptional regulator/MocR family aminotransferase
MAQMGTTCGPEILLPIGPPRPGRPRRAQLESALREAVRTARLAAGQRLPASRVLAGYLGVSRRLVVEVYTQLSAEGYLVSRPGSGTRVSDLPLPPATSAAPLLDHGTAHPGGTCARASPRCPRSPATCGGGRGRAH